MTDRAGAGDRPDQELSGKGETIRRVVQAAKHEFAVAGLAGAKMDEIARQGGVSKQLVYHYFGSKNELFIAVLNGISETIIGDLVGLDLSGLEPRRALHALLGRAFDHYRDDRDLARLAQEAIAFHNDNPGRDSSFPVLAPDLVDKLAAILEAGVAQGLFRPNVDARLYLASALLMVTAGFTNSYLVSTMVGFDTRSGEGMERWRDHAIELIGAAIASEGGDKRK